MLGASVVLDDAGICYICTAFENVPGSTFVQVCLPHEQSTGGSIRFMDHLFRAVLCRAARAADRLDLKCVKRWASPWSAIHMERQLLL